LPEEIATVGLLGEMTRLSQNKKTVKEHFEDSLKNGDLTGVEINSNFVELWYWMKFEGVSISVNGVTYGLDRVGKLSKLIESGETVRTVWSKLRSELKLKKFKQAQALDNDVTT